MKTQFVLIITTTVLILTIFLSTHYALKPKCAYMVKNNCFNGVLEKYDALPENPDSQYNAMTDTSDENPINQNTCETHTNAQIFTIGFDDPNVVAFRERFEDFVKYQSGMILFNEDPKEQAALEFIVKNETNNQMRAWATRHISNQTFLEELAQESNNISVRRAAAPMLHDLKLLRKYFENEEEDYLVRVNIIRNFTDQDYLLGIVNNDKNDDIRREAVWYLTDKNILEHIARYDKNERVRVQAAFKSENKNILTDIASSTTNVNTRNMMKSSLKSILMQEMVNINDIEELLDKLPNNTIIIPPERRPIQ